MLKRIELMNDWYFAFLYKPGMEKSAALDGFEAVALPHSNKELPYNYFDETSYQVISCYKKILPELQLQPGQQLLLRFEAVMAAATVFINGELLGEHLGGYTPFEFELGSRLLVGRPNILTVVVDATEREDIPPFGGQIDYLCYGGIYREVSLDVYQRLSVRNVQAVCRNPLD
ncbi:MAG: glycoside hydrolase family 2 protein, partial [Spirochaetes bacterium]|nr:glycoside hydrolase family 2 protein [Spirochaetota bacterium]